MTVGNEIAYYLRPVNGSDSNDGKSFGGAWKTWQKVITELCTVGGSGITSGSASLFLVNEGGAYTGPWHTGTGESVPVDYVFNDPSLGFAWFSICGLSADGTYDPNTNFEFDLSGFTGQYWLNAFGSADYNRTQFRNITWKNANSTYTSNIIYEAYAQRIVGDVQGNFINCIFEDNETQSTLVDCYQGRLYYNKCIFRRNNTSNTALLGGGGAGNSYYIPEVKNCIFDSNQTTASSAAYIFRNYPTSNGAAARVINCLFYNNGYDSNSACVYSQGYNDGAGLYVENSTFFNNAGTAIRVQSTNVADTSAVNYGNSNWYLHLTNNVFVLNNKSIDMDEVPGIRYTDLTKNVFYNNTVEDIPNIIEGVEGSSGGNYVFDPEFTNGYSGDFSVPHDSRLFSYSTVPGIPIGGSFVQKKSFTTTTSGSLSFGSGEVGDTVTVSGKSYQKVNASPPVWRRYFTTPPLTGIFSPSSLANLYGWYDASSSVGLSGVNVVSFPDKSSTGNDLLCSSSTILSAGQNGLDVIDVTGGGGIVSSDASYNTTTWVGFIVMKPTATDNAFVAFGAPSTNSYFIAAQNGSTSNATSVSGGTKPTFRLNTSPFSPSNRGAAYSAMANQYTIFEINAVDFNTNLGGAPWEIENWDGGIYDFEGQIAEIIILNAQPTIGERQQIEGYLAHKWGLTSVLSSTHPFKNYAP